MKLTARNDFHGTECEVDVAETYEAKMGGYVAVVSVGEINKAGRKLCGISQCVCTGPHALTDDDGNVYSITTPDPGSGSRSAWGQK